MWLIKAEGGCSGLRLDFLSPPEGISQERMSARERERKRGKGKAIAWSLYLSYFWSLFLSCSDDFALLCLSLLNLNVLLSSVYLNSGAQIIDLMILVVDVVKGMQTQTAECLLIGQLTCSRMIVILNKTDMLPSDKRQAAIDKMTKRMHKTLENTR